jgi:hypothetical protein
MPLSLEKFSTASTNDPSNLQSHSGSIAAAKQASQIKQQCDIKHQNLQQGGGDCKEGGGVVLS